jgi:hypothetical protein
MIQREVDCVAGGMSCTCSIHLKGSIKKGRAPGRGKAYPENHHHYLLAAG